MANSSKRNLKNKFFESMGLSVITSSIALVLAILAGAVLILLSGTNPIEAYGALIKGAFGTPVAFTATLSKSVPLLLSGLAVALAFKCSVFNIGVEGQLMVGAMAAAIAGVYFKMPAFLHIPFVLLSSMIAGMLWAFLPAILKQKASVNVVISTIMFNYIAQYLVQYLILGPFKASGAAAATQTIHASAKLPVLLQKPYKLNIGVLIAILVVVAIYFLLNKTTRGYEMRAVGINPQAAHTSGINVGKNMFLALLLSGAIAGLAGGIEVSGTLNKIINGFSTGYGFSGIPVALMAHNNPFAIIITAFLFGSMRSGSFMMQTSVGISVNMVDVIQGLIIVFLCTENVIRYYIKKRQGGKSNA